MRVRRIPGLVTEEKIPPTVPPVIPAAGANANATFVTVNTEPTLPQSRKLTAGANITLTDGGALGPITIDAASGAISLKDEGVVLGSVISLDFVGANVAASRVGTAGTITVTGGGAGTFDWGKAIHAHRASYL